MVRRTEAGKLRGKPFATWISASTPPAEVPTARMARLAIPFSAANYPAHSGASMATIDLWGGVPFGSRRERTDEPNRTNSPNALALPNDTGAAFVVVVHLDPEHRSELVNIIAARTRMPVVEIGARQHLE